MAGYGNRTNTEPEFDGQDTKYDLHHHTEPYTGGHPEHKSGTVGGAGFGNKSRPETNPEEHDSSDLRFGSHQNTDPYSGGHPEYKSGTVGGVGYGNKTSAHGEGM